MDRPTGVISLQGRDYPTWGFVLNKAHEMGLLSIETTLIQIPTDDNGKTAIVQAVATFAPLTEGAPPRRFSGIGDAGPHNVGPKIAGATLRMAETRAMGRALRTGTNIGETMYEEIDDREPAAPVARATPAAPTPARARTAEVLERNERPIPVDRPGVVVGFEDSYTDESGKVFRRADLVKFAESSLGEALKLGVRLETITPSMSANPHLVAWGKRVRPILAAAREAVPAEAAV